MLEVVARADGQSVTAVIRAAIDAYIEERRLNEDFMERLRYRQEDERALYERFAR